MHYVYLVGGGFVAGVVVTRLYYAKAVSAFNSLEAQVKAKL